MVVRLDMSLAEAERIADCLATTPDGLDRAALRDVLWLRAVLLEQRRRTAVSERKAFQLRADRILHRLSIDGRPSVRSGAYREAR